MTGEDRKQILKSRVSQPKSSHPAIRRILQETYFPDDSHYGLRVISCSRNITTVKLHEQEKKQTYIISTEIAK